MALSHELQHAIQHANARKVRAVNGLVPQLPKTIVAALKLQWADIPIAREARIVSRRLAVNFSGEQRVTQYIDEKIAEGVARSDGVDVANWQFVGTLTDSSSVDLVDDTPATIRAIEELQARA